MKKCSILKVMKSTKTFNVLKDFELSYRKLYLRMFSKGYAVRKAKVCRDPRPGE